MADQIPTSVGSQQRPPGPPISHPPSSQTRRRKFREGIDVLAHGVVWVGGIGTILSILGIFVYLLIEVAPLFFGPSGNLTVEFPAAGSIPRDHKVLAVGVDEYQEVAYVLHDKGVAFFQVPTGKPLTGDAFPPFTQVVTAVGRSSGRGHHFGLGTSEGHVIPLDITMRPSFVGDVRTITPSFTFGEPISADPGQGHLTQVAFQRSEDTSIMAVYTDADKLWVTRVSEPDEFSFGEESSIDQFEIMDKPDSAISVLSLTRSGRRMVAGTVNGQVAYWDLAQDDGPVLVGTIPISHPDDPVTALSFLIGDRTIVVGTQSGMVSSWRFMEGREIQLQSPWIPSHTFSPHPTAVTQISPSQRDKGFLTGDKTGHVRLHHSTSGQTLLEFETDGQATQALMFAPKANGGVLVDVQGTVRMLSIQNAHPEITFQTLFQSVLYEGYEEPKDIWQSSSGSDDFEPKFGMMPLIFGTLKGTVYAMLLAVPLAIMGAVYTAMFLPVHLRNLIKPIVEIMAVLPSVVLGFLAGLWLAPLLERIVPAVLGSLVIVPFSVVGACLAWQVMPRAVRTRVGMGGELVLIILVMIAAIAGSLVANHQIESVFFASNYKQWFSEHLGLHYDQRNALVISFAMGFAVIPIIFSISEDALSNVPRHLIAGSLAMGATQWQTLTKLVLISASPGIFSALMIGFGRAIGETMIVLMATGNTPIMDWSVFNGFRTLSANIAVEMPEAPHGGTLYRILFLSGLLLFGFTFAINTVAEVVRQRLRQKYSQF